MSNKINPFFNKNLNFIVKKSVVLTFLTEARLYSMLKDDISKDDTESRCKVFLYV